MRTKSLLILLLIMVAILPVASKFNGSFPPEVYASTLPDSSGRLIVGFKDLTSRFPIQDFLAKYGGGQVAGMNYALKFAVVVPGNAAAFLRLASQDSRISYIEPDDLVYATFTPNDPSFSSQWGPPAISATSAWDITLGSKSVVVAVIDTGVQYNHPDLSSNMWKNSDGTYGCNYVNSYSSSCSNTNVNDDNGHGTHVAGIVAATINNGMGVAGISQSRIMAVKVLNSQGSGSWSSVASGIQWATDHGAKIISMSLGGSSSATIQNAVQYAYSRGVLLIAAAGNQNGGAIQYPASYSQVIAVTAIDQNSKIASFSSTGSKAELTAPGVNIYSTCSGSPGVCSGSQYSSLSGTSMAAPFVSGVAALVWSVDSTISRDAVRSILDSTADDLGSQGRDSYYGYGRVDAYGAVLAANPSPDFTISLSPISITILRPSAGTNAGTLGITTQSLNGFNSHVTYSLQGAPSGVTYSFDINPVTPPANGVATSQITLTVDSSALIGTYTLTLVGSDDTITHQISFTLIIPSPPTAPTGLGASAGNGYVTLTWSPPSSDGGSPITGYNVYRGMSSGGEDATPIQTLAGNVQTYTDPGLTNTVTYYYQVTATNAVGESPKSNEVNAAPVATPVLSVTVTTNKATYTRGWSYQYVLITVTVKSNGLPVQGASVSVTVYYPNGSVAARGSATTNSNGQMSFRYRLTPTSTRGTYNVSASASMSGYIAGTASTTFIVQ
jgi:hypothetical protein